jgi:hypothetical protein
MRQNRHADRLVSGASLCGKTAAVAGKSNFRQYLASVKVFGQNPKVNDGTERYG